MNETDFEKRLHGHLAARASLIEVPDHKFVQTKVVPFQPRRNRFNNLVMAAAGVAVVHDARVWRSASHRGRF